MVKNSKITSPQILSEVSNFLDEKADFCLGLKKYIELSEEKYLKSEDLSNRTKLKGSMEPQIDTDKH